MAACWYPLSALSYRSDCPKQPRGQLREHVAARQGAARQGAARQGARQASCLDHLVRFLVEVFHCLEIQKRLQDLFSPHWSGSRQEQAKCEQASKRTQTTAHKPSSAHLIARIIFVGDHIAAELRAPLRDADCEGLRIFGELAVSMAVVAGV
jgi:hypothetical protein